MSLSKHGLNAGVVGGGGDEDPRTITGGDLSMVPVQTRINGSFHEAGLGANAMDDPTRAVAWLAERRARRGEPLSAGDMVLTGSLTRLVDLQPGEP